MAQSGWGEVPHDRRLAEVPKGGRPGAEVVAGTDASVLISGESGTGKELIAQFIHHHSRRASRQLVPDQRRRSPEPLLKERDVRPPKGAFTGADRDKPGLLETAHGGTLFLDELTEMPMSLQAKLLRVIQDGVVRRVGFRAGGRGGGCPVRVRHEP